MPNLINKMVVREMTDVLAGAEGMVMVSLSGLTVAETEGLRNELAGEGVRLLMVRNRLAKLALKEHGFDVPDDLFVGNVAMAWGTAEDAIHAARVLYRSDERKAGKVALRGGVLDGGLLSADQAAALSDLPTRDQLRAQLLGVISGPARALVCLLNAPPSALARVLQARVDKGQES